MSVDQDVLKHEAYASQAPLAARLSIYDCAYPAPWRAAPAAGPPRSCQQPAFDLPGFALQQLGDVDGPVLDVGWGTGTFTNRLRAERPGLRVIPVDLAIGMGPEVVGEVDRPPFATGSAGAVLAMHMLYYATDPRAALGELRRVLRPATGRLLVSTNASDDKLENGKLWREALVDLGVFDPPAYPFEDRRFSLAVAERLITEVFGGCDVHHHRYDLVVPAVEPVLAYVESTRSRLSRLLPAGLAWDDCAYPAPGGQARHPPRSFMGAVERRIRLRVERSGAFVIKGHVGVIVAVA